MRLRVLRRLVFAVATISCALSFGTIAQAKECAKLKAPGECKDDCAWDKKKKICGPSAANKAAKGGAKAPQGKGADPSKAPGTPPPAKGSDLGKGGKGKPPTATAGGKSGKAGGKGATPDKPASKPSEPKSVAPAMPEEDVGPVGDEDF